MTQEIQNELFKTVAHKPCCCCLVREWCMEFSNLYTRYIFNIFP